MKKRLTLQNVYILFLSIHILMLIAGAFLIKEDKFNLGEENPYTEITPTSYDITEDGTQQYTFQVASNGLDDYLMFYTNHQEVHVYADNELIYKRSKVDTVFGHTAGSIWNIMAFPSDAKEIVVTLKAVYKSGEGNEHTFYQGNGVEMYRQMIQASFPTMIVSVLIIMLGVCMIIYWILICGKTRVAKELLYMGIFVLIMGFWAFGEEKATIILLDNRPYATFVTFSQLMLMGVTFMLFLKHYHHGKNGYFHKVLAFYSFGGMSLMMVLQALDIADFKQTAFIVHLVLICDLLYLLQIILVTTREGKNKRNVRLNIAGLIVLTAAVAFELYAYYAQIRNMQGYAMLGLFIYIVILGIEVGANASEKIEEVRKAEIYKELAEKDILTKCYNRNAYNADIQKKIPDGTYIIMLDLNDLKKCNDTLGHMAGDQYLTDSAELIKKIFSDYGKIYRIGGDEFCIIMNTTEEQICDLLQQLIQEEEAYNKQSQIVHMQIASGYARYNASTDTDLDQTRCRADELMYENKKELKAGRRYN